MPDIIVPELLPPSEDGVFRTLLIHADAKPILRDIIASFLHIPVVDVAVINSEMPIANKDEKQERFDVNCTTGDGNQIDVEMQADAMPGDNFATGHKNIKSRAIYYLCDLHAKQPGRSIRYDNLKHSYQMTFCGFTLFPERKKFISRFSFRDEEGIELSGDAKIIFVELTKLNEIIKKPVETMTGEEMWSAFFAYASDRKYNRLLKEMIAAKEEIKMASELLQTISKDEIERAHFRSRRMFQMDMEHGRLVARDEGRAEGEKAEREKWQSVVTEKDAENEKLRRQLAEIQKRLAN
jgi:predicted transposase/invertase (TIGR01784 family)